MDKNAIKKFAVWARNELLNRVMQKALAFGIQEGRIAPAESVLVDDKPMTAIQRTQRAALVQQVEQKGYQHVMDDVAYTWFNRFIALRFMEVNGYLPSRVRVFTDENGKFNPQIIDEAIHLDLDGLDMTQVYAYKEANQTGALYRYLLTTQCNALSKLLPRMFQPIQDYTELLLPDNLLREGSVIEQMVTLIPEEDWQDQVQIIGWLYQYYNTEPKDKVFADLKRNIKITKDKIPAATQLFTPDWIVRYMVENSLGRLWLEGHPNETLKAGWKYYLDEAEQEPAVQEQLAKIRAGYAAIKPEDIRVIDPCMGSGHILVYMFDVLVQIYEDYGYTTREAVESIIRHNLYGLDIDDRAAQLTYFAVMMKARQYDRRFLSRKDEDGNPNIPQPHVYAIVESNGVDRSVIRQLGAGMPGIEYNNAVTQMNALLDALHDAKEYGSILTVDELDWALLRRFVAAGASDVQLSMDTLGLDEAMARLPGLIDVGEALGQKYDAVVTNPPYMGASNMNSKLSGFIKENYTDYKSDFFSVFIYRGSMMVKPNGKLGFFSPYVWMFIQSYEKLRQYLYKQATIESLIQFEYSAFEEATVPVCTFTFTSNCIQKRGVYLRLTDFRGGMEVQRQKTLEAIANHQCGFYYEQNADNFSKIPGAPLAYWVSDNFIKAYANRTIGECGFARSGLQTGDNNLFLKFWQEVCFETIAFGMRNKSEFLSTGRKWAPQIKGGDYRKWYGNFDYVVNWKNDGEEIRKCEGCRLNAMGNDELFFRKGVTWSHTTSSVFGARFLPGGCLFNVEAPTLFLPAGNDFYFLAFLNSCVAQYYLSAINSTMHYLVGNIVSLPIYYAPNNHIDRLVSESIEHSRTDWDSFETSWDFQHHPLIPSQPCTVESAFARWSQECEARFQQLKSNEEELNRIFIDIYGLQDELTPDVDEKDVTVRRADLGRDIRSLISYAVGVMFGRYSLDVPGLAYAGGAWDASRYTTIIPDKDGILPICDDEYFEDDIVGRFVRFIEVVYGKDTLEQNLAFIASALGGKGTPREIIRSYFLNDFYKDHLRIYQKRPIYWLFDSGKKNGFKCLIYMHRYAPDTIARIRTDYVHEQQSRYRTALATLERQIAGASGSERVRLTKQQQKLQAQAEEIRLYEEKIHHLADQMIAIDLDDGVKHNYEIFRAVLAPIK